MLQYLLWPIVVALDNVLSMGQIRLFDILRVCQQMTFAKLMLEIELFDHLTEHKQIIYV